MEIEDDHLVWAWGPGKAGKEEFMYHGDKHIDHKTNDNGFLVNHRHRWPNQSSRSANTLITKNILRSNNVLLKKT